MNQLISIENISMLPVSKEILALLSVLWGKREMLSERLPLILSAVRDLLPISSFEALPKYSELKSTS